MKSYKQIEKIEETERFSPSSRKDPMLQYIMSVK